MAGTRVKETECQVAEESAVLFSRQGPEDEEDSHTVFRSFQAELRDLDMVWEGVIETAQNRAR